MIGFWIFLAVYVVCEAWLFEKGYDTLFFSHKTEHEKEIRRQKLNLAKEVDREYYENPKGKKK